MLRYVNLILIVLPRLLLWDCDNRSYSYYIETSYDNMTWSRAVDKQTVACRYHTCCALFHRTLPFRSSSWEILTFSPRIVVFIRICGTHNTANEVFHCVHFECPCRPDVLKSYMNEQASISTTDDYEENSVTYKQFYKSIEPSLSTATTSHSLSTMDNGSLIQTHTLLPFTIKPSSAAIYPLEKENDETSLL
jgi:hypothetical protein